MELLSKRDAPRVRRSCAGSPRRSCGSTTRCASSRAAERIPRDRPVVFVLNHPNGLLDPIVLRVATGRATRFLAKSTLFGNPLGRLAMDAFGSIPVYRAHEAGARGKDASRNDESFARCRAALARGEALALFPEGTSHSDPQLRPLKTGAARIALSAEREVADAGGRLGAVIVPVGLFYERKALFRSRVLLDRGRAARDRRRCCRATAPTSAPPSTRSPTTIRARLDDVVLQAESRELLAGIARVARWTGSAAEATTPTTPTIWRPSTGARASCCAAYERLRARDPARVDAVAAEARAYARTLRHLGVRDPWGLEIELIAPGPCSRARWRSCRARAAARDRRAPCWAGCPIGCAGEVARARHPRRGRAGHGEAHRGRGLPVRRPGPPRRSSSASAGARSGDRRRSCSASAAATSRCASRSSRTTPPKRCATCGCAPSTSTPPAASASAAARWPTPSRARCARPSRGLGRPLRMVAELFAFTCGTQFASTLQR